MGTLQNRLGHVFHAIAEACRGLDTDLVISLGGGSEPERLGKLPGDPIVVGFAPQLELLARARLTITHAGMNTALETPGARRAGGGDSGGQRSAGRGGAT